MGTAERRRSWWEKEEMGERRTGASRRQDTLGPLWCGHAMMRVVRSSNLSGGIVCRRQEWGGVARGDDPTVEVAFGNSTSCRA